MKSTTLPRLLTIPQVQREMKLGRVALKKAVEAGLIKPVVIGSRQLFSEESLRRLATPLPNDSDTTNTG